MLIRLTIAFALVLALFAAPVRASARSCIIYDTPVQKACQAGCCTNQTCCATSPKNTAPVAQPLAKGSATHELNATVTPVLTGTAPSVPEYQDVTKFALDCSALSPPRLALLCTFLI
jgi:hypothetical protein